MPFVRAGEGPQSLKLGGPGADWASSPKPDRSSGFVALGALGGLLLRMSAFLLSDHHKVVPASARFASKVLPFVLKVGSSSHHVGLGSHITTDHPVIYCHFPSPENSVGWMREQIQRARETFLRSHSH